ncbi:MAG TPA: F0F1 ATP synthase subunit epsilon [Desulfobacteraceae bacterium]|nr:F0F1 ATP synthase subunit epsilon [Desulfobacteraceae bacterium]
MAGDIFLEVVTPEKIVVSEDAQMVVAPGTEGEFGALVGHTPFLTTLQTGAIRYIDNAGKERSIFVSGGFAETLPDKVTVLAESAERRRNIDVTRAEAAGKRAEVFLAEDRKKEEINFARAKLALERSIRRIAIAKTK